MPKVMMILYTNLKLHKKKLQKQDSGSNCFIEVVIYMIHYMQC